MIAETIASSKSSENERAGSPIENRYQVSRHRNFKALCDVIHIERGLVLITGQHGSGKTFMLFGALKNAVLRGRSARVENTMPLEYDVPGVHACNADDSQLQGTITALTNGEPVEDVIGAQIYARINIDGDWQFALERLEALKFLAQKRLVIAEFFSADPIPKKIIKTLKAPLESQGVPLITLHITA
jgi:hypothetical protein